MKDSSLTEKEIDRINFAVEKAKNRFIPEELIINYSSLFDTEPTTIVSTEEYLMIGSESGLFSFNGRRWQTFTVENGLPSENILTLTAVNNSVLIGTDKGLVRYDGLVLKAVGPEGALPEGQITAIGASSLLDIWVVINDQLYHYDGENWTGSRNYTVILDDTPEKIAEKFAVYGTSGEKEKFISLMYQINKQAAETAALPVTDEINIDSTVAIESVEASEIEDSSSTPVEGNDIISPSTIVEPTTEIVDDSLLETDEIIPDSTTGSIDETEELANEAVAEEITDEVTTEAAAEDYKLNMNPGDVIKVPYLAEFKGDVTTIHSGLNGKLWIGTSYGVVYFDGEKWVLPGYYDYTVEENQTLDELLLVNAEDNPLDSIDYCAIVNDINDINQGQLSTGQTIKLYRNPTAAPVNNIVSQRDRIYFATKKGLIEYDGVEWGHVDLKGLDKANVINVEVSGNELWFTSDRKIIIKANGKTDISMMYVKWLPELADDLYYAFFSVVSSKEGWGTFGGNMTFISYGTITRTGEGSPEAIGTFESFDLAFTGSYGTALTSKLSGGISAKFLYSKLADVGAGLEQGKGTSSGFAVDFGLLYRWNRRLTLGLSITNLGPKMAYIDAAQADPLPRNLALGFAYKLLQKDYYHFLIIGDINKSLVGINDGISEELKQVVFNGGAEFLYANILALRAGYIYDQEGDIKTVTLGVGLAPLTKIKFDFSYIPSNSNVILGNTLRISLSILP
ncbi:MAG: PorV/PorQ family protein [Candidatus Zixiibacteriota bacterium]